MQLLHSKQPSKVLTPCFCWFLSRGNVHWSKLHNPADTLRSEKNLAAFKADELAMCGLAVVENLPIDPIARTLRTCRQCMKVSCNCGMLQSPCHRDGSYTSGSAPGVRSFARISGARERAGVGQKLNKSEAELNDLMWDKEVSVWNWFGRCFEEVPGLQALNVSWLVRETRHANA